ncbi:hypothetical protein KAI87_01585 [Myxococcota bacterium]|nr:hypothetical protein [Myxococcota bacterium]
MSIKIQDHNKELGSLKSDGLPEKQPEPSQAESATSGPQLQSGQGVAQDNLSSERSVRVGAVAAKPKPVTIRQVTIRTQKPDGSFVIKTIKPKPVVTVSVAKPKPLKGSQIPLAKIRTSDGVIKNTITELLQKYGEDAEFKRTLNSYLKSGLFIEGSAAYPHFTDGERRALMSSLGSKNPGEAYLKMAGKFPVPSSLAGAIARIDAAVENPKIRDIFAQAMPTDAYSKLIENELKAIAKPEQYMFLRRGVERLASAKGLKDRSGIKKLDILSRSRPKAIWQQAEAALVAGDFLKSREIMTLAGCKQTEKVQLTILSALKEGNFVAARYGAKELAEQHNTPTAAKLETLFKKRSFDFLKDKALIDTLNTDKTQWLWQGLTSPDAVKTLELSKSARAPGQFIARGKKLVSQDIKDAAEAVALLQKQKPVDGKKLGKARTELNQLMEPWRAKMLDQSTLSLKDARFLADSVSADSKVPEGQAKDILRDYLPEVLRWTNGHGLASLESLTLDGKRAWAKNTMRQINIGVKPTADALKRVLFHEFGHHFEFNMKETQLAAGVWIKGRSTSKETKMLKDLVPKSKYKDTEIAWPDHFLSPYVGKFYKAGFTEVISMGLERFRKAATMADMLSKDADHFYLVLGMLRE